MTTDPTADATWLRRHAPSLAVVVLIAFAAHAPALRDGLFFDDHWHRVQMRERGWGWTDLIESATFDLPGRLIEIWWQTEPLQWRYARPLSMAFQKLEWRIGDERPRIVHAAGLLWHTACAVLVYLLAAQVFPRRRWAVFAAAFFAVNPHSVFAVSWTAARNAIISGTLVVLSLLLYIRGSGLRARLFQGERSGGESAANDRPSRSVWMAAAFASWIAALFAREVAVVVPVLFVGFDVAFGGLRAARRRVPLYTAMAAMLGAYLFWRLVIFPQGPVPHVYYARPEGLAGLGWLLGKFVHQLLCLTIYTPLIAGPFTSTETNASATLVLLMALPVAALAIWYALAARGAGRGLWYWPLFTVLAMVPVLPVFNMPHFAYLPTVGYAVMAALVLSRLPRRISTVAATLAMAATLWTLGLDRVAWRGICRTSQLLVEDAADSKPDERARDVFFIDLPIANIYAMVPLRDRWQRPDLSGHVLTFATHPLRMDALSTVVQRDAHRIEVSLPDPGYFAGFSGRMLIDGLRPGEPLRRGDTIAGDSFDVTIDDADGRGVRRMTFAFRRPLSDPTLQFFRSSAIRPAERVRFRGDEGPFPWTVSLPDLSDSQHAAWRAEHARLLRESEGYFRLMRAMRRVVQSDLFLTGG